MPTLPSRYDNWTREELIARLSVLDPPRPQHKPVAPTKPQKPFDFASHRRRKIALQFCYSGWEYNGLAFQNLPTPLPTVEGVLFDALAKARLIDPGAGFDGCGWERCGRTDRGVSAARQVVSLWVRSALGSGSDTADTDVPIPPGNAVQSDPEPLTPASDPESISESGLADDFSSLTTSDISNTSIMPRRRYEHDYLSVINRVLPPTIRVIAWSPVAPTFSARFNCRYRHYKYFFSSEGLDISLMREGASRLVGDHDFRNLCKLDPGKQITMFVRKVIRTEIEPLHADSDIHVFNLVGSAFLYHQVRHIMAILFLVGTGIEHPSAVTSLLNVAAGLEQRREGDPELVVVDSKPDYQMADALPLMLWDCGYGENDVAWRTSGSDTPGAGGEGIGADLFHQLHSIYTRSQVATTLNEHFFAAAKQHHPAPVSPFPFSQTGLTRASYGKMLNLPLGGGTFKRSGKYVPVLTRKRLEHVDIVNERWRLGKGHRKDEKKKLESGDADDGNE